MLNNFLSCIVLVKNRIIYILNKNQLRIPLSMILIVCCNNYAIAGPCTPQSGTPVTGSVDVSQFVSSSSNDYVGYTHQYNISQSVPSVPVTCECQNGYIAGTGFWDWTSFLVPTENVSGITYGILNDYIGIAVMPRPDTNTWVPYSDMTSTTFNSCGTQPSGGGAGIAQLIVRKKIIGTVVAPNILFYQKGVNTYQGESYRVPEIQLKFYGTISVPQNCELDAGEVINIDLGDVWSGKFDIKGQKAKGFSPVTRSIAVKCSGGVDANANLTVRFQSTPDSNVSNAIKTDNPDVGIMITDQNGRVVTPNAGVIPFQLNNSQATYTFQTYPVSTTGNPPTEGRFTALAYMRVDFA